jgi:anhydro-N-acetylmuramic acid kinase
MTVRFAAGAMTGTSIDSLDVALVRIKGNGLAMQAHFIRGLSRSLGGLRLRLRALADQQPMSAGEITQLVREFSLLHCDCLRELAQTQPLDLASLHGQTVYHKPPCSWQLINPAIIAHGLKTPVVFDLRAMDLAAGGQGAPITPIADWILLGRDLPLDVINLGGFCNITHLPPRQDHSADALARIGGADVCVCNQLLDTIARTTLGTPCDTDGQTAARGQPDPAALEHLAQFLQHQAAAGRSLGTGDELRSWIATHQQRLAPETLGATACEALGRRIAAAIKSPMIALAGGGVLNRALTAAIRRHCRGEVLPTDDWGIPCTYREAACFAVLGALCQDRVPITLPQITRLEEPPPISGCWIYP